MYYAGQHDGEDAHGVIKELSTGNFLVSLEVGSSRGGVAVTAYATGAGGALGVTHATNESPCFMDINFNGRQMSVKEVPPPGWAPGKGLIGCMIFHGASVSFDGTMARSG